MPSHVVSASKQFTVFAQDQGFAAGLATFADKVKDRLLRRLMLRDEWRAPVVIVIRTRTNLAARAAASIETGVYEADRQLKYQLSCVVPPPLNTEQFVRELVTLLAMEIANRGQPPRSEEVAVPPVWFTEGLTQNLLGDVRSIEMDLVERALQSPQGAGLNTFVDAARLPPPGIEQELFKAKCKFLVRSLFALRDGPHRTTVFLRSLRPGSSWRQAFQAGYGEELGDPAAAELWWERQLSQRFAPSPTNRLTAQETDDKLRQILTLEAIHRDPSTGRQITKTVSLMDLRNYMDKPGTEEMIQDRIRRLELLQLTAHQSYLPAIALYIEAFNHVRLERFRKLSGTLAEAEDALQAARRQNAQIAASLDKFEAQEMNRDLLFLYRDYFQTFDEIKSFEKTRDSAIKDYLDQFQSRGDGTNSIQ